MATKRYSGDLLDPDSSSQAYSSPEAFPAAEEHASETKTTRDFGAQAEDILSTQTKFGAETARETYVDQEEDPALKLLGEVTLEASAAAKATRKLGLLQRLKKHYDDPEMLDRIQEWINLEKPARLEYHDRLRQLIISNSEDFTSLELRDWLADSSGDTDWARQTVAGIGAEVAAARCLRYIPDVKRVRYGNAEEDGRGADLVVSLKDGRELLVDVKYGVRHVPTTEELHASSMKLHVPTGTLDDNFEISASVQPEIMATFARTAGLARGRFRRSA